MKRLANFRRPRQPRGVAPLCASFFPFWFVPVADGKRCLYSPTTLRWKTFVAHFHAADGRNCLVLVASGLRILQDFAGICRCNLLIWFRINSGLET
jgi:hypothetical protein